MRKQLAKQKACRGNNITCRSLRPPEADMTQHNISSAIAILVSSNDSWLSVICTNIV